MSPARARRYLEKYFTKFRKPSIDIFWGSVDEFASGSGGDLGRPLITDVSDPGAAPSPSARSNPYVGPRRSATASRSTGAHGRSTSCATSLIAERIVLLYSPSGAGKTSLLEAGLRPELERRDFVVLPTIRVSHEAPTSLDGAVGQPLRAQHAAVAGGGAAARAAAERRRAGRHRPPDLPRSGSAPTCHRGSTPACSSTSSRSCSRSTPPTSTRRPRSSRSSASPCATGAGGRCSRCARTSSPSSTRTSP